jgi:hypothetical protein
MKKWLDLFNKETQIRNQEFIPTESEINNEVTLTIKYDEWDKQPYMNKEQQEISEEAKKRAANYMSLKGALESKNSQYVDFSNPNANKITSGTTNKLMENRKTAMQELFDNLEAIDIKVPIGVKQIFLEKEKEQIMDAYRRVSVGLYTEAEGYYNKTYGK